MCHMHGSYLHLLYLHLPIQIQFLFNFKGTLSDYMLITNMVSISYLSSSSLFCVQAVKDVMSTSSSGSVNGKPTLVLYLNLKTLLQPISIRVEPVLVYKPGMGGIEVDKEQWEGKNIQQLVRLCVELLSPLFVNVKK